MLGKIFPQFKIYCFGWYNPGKSDHQRKHTKKNTSHKVERLCNVSHWNCSPVLLLTEWNKAFQVQMAVSLVQLAGQLGFCPSHLTEQKSRQEPSASSTVPAHRAGPAWGGEGTQQGAPVAGGLQPSEVRLMVTKRPVVLTGHELEVQNIKKVHPS